jgi:hypothetical protein
MNPAIVEKNKEPRETRARRKDRVTSPVQTVREFCQLAIRSGRGWWLIPMMGMLLVLGVLLVFIQVIEYVAPFVYTIF